MNKQTKTKFWWMHAEATQAEKILRLENLKKPTFYFANRLALSKDGLQHFKESWEVTKIKRPVTPVLKVSNKTINSNILWTSQLFFSKILRDAIELKDDCIQYIDIDSSESHPNFQLMDYKMAHILKVGDAIDLDASDFEKYSQIDIVTGLKDEGWRANIEMQMKMQPIRICFKENFDPPAPLFTLKWHDSLLATDELADRVLNSGITDVTFQDICYIDPEFKSIRVKTKDGIQILSC
jgi:hypothetical protein